MFNSMTCLSSKEQRNEKDVQIVSLPQDNKNFTIFSCFFCSTVEELNSQEFLMEIEYVWGKRPFWYGENPERKGDGEKAYWGWLEDWAEPNRPPTLCFLGTSRTQVFERIKMYLSF